MTPHDLDIMATATATLIKRAIADATAPLLERLAAVEARALVPGPQGPVGERGRDGLDGKDGAPGAPGERGLIGPAGPPGPPGERGIDGRDGRDGKDGKDGRDGIDGDVGAIGPRGEKGLDGRDGTDGLGFDDLTVDQHGRDVFFTFVRGEQKKEWRVSWPVVLYRGVWEAGTYTAGDGVTWGGSMWIAHADTTDKPGTSSAWQLAVKCGRDGKEGKAGPPGERGPKGDKGDPGRHVS